MKIKQFANLPNIKALNIVAVSSLAMGIAASISAAPAQAITFNTGELDFGVFTSPFAANVNPVAGNNFNVTFNPSGTASIFNATDSFTPTFTPGSTIGSNSPTVNFSNISGSTYRLNQALVFNFATATPTSFTLNQNSTFTETEIFNNSGVRVGAGLQLASSTGTFFTNGGNITNIPTFAFSFTDTGIPTGGLFVAQASATAVPEPFSIIGTIVGGTAAFRMRKKLANAAKN
ncbi:hypothetical protein [Chamaesiphon sp.]|uniref:hypothetical protein n=1 Tax=Chamaesiphon sp. TaxID=2814140 RepID=UPI003593C900